MAADHADDMLLGKAISRHQRANLTLTWVGRAVKDFSLMAQQNKQEN
jgi:hypothetical protein